MSTLFVSAPASFSLVNINERRCVQFNDGKVLSLYLVRNMARAMGNIEFLDTLDKAAGLDLKLKAEKTNKVSGERIHRVFQSKPHSHTRNMWDGRDMTKYEIGKDDNGKVIYAYHSKGRRLGNRDFMTLKPDYKQRVQRKGKKVILSKHWTGERSARFNFKAKGQAIVDFVDSIIDSNAASVNMAAIKGYAVANPYEAQAKAWANRAISDGLNPRQRVSTRKPNYYLTPACDWTPAVYSVETVAVAAQQYIAHAKVAYDWDTAMAVDGERRAQVWAKATYRRAANREQFTLEAIYKLLGYKPSLTVGKQAVVKERPTFKSVGAAAYVDQHNKVNNGVNKTPGGVLYNQLIDIVVKAGGTLSTIIKLDNETVTGKVVVAICPINDVKTTGMEIISGLSPMVKANCALEKSMPFFDPAPTPTMSRTRGFGYAADYDKDSVAKEFGQVVAAPFRGLIAALSTARGFYEVALPVWSSVYYCDEVLKAYDAEGKARNVGPSDLHLVLNLPGRQRRNEQGTPDAEIAGRRRYVRDMMFTGKAEDSIAMDVYMDENPGFNITVHKSINDCVADGEGYYFNNKPTGVHIALVVAEVATVDGRDDIEFWKVAGDNDGQSRAFVNKMTVIYIPVETAFKLFDPAPAPGKYNAAGTGMWPLFPQVEPIVGVTCTALTKRTNNMPCKTNPWTLYEKYCLPPLDFTMSNTLSVTPVTETKTVEINPATLAAPTPVVERAQAVEKLNGLLLNKTVAVQVKAYYEAKKQVLVGETINVGADFDYKAFVRAKDYMDVIGTGLNAANFTGHYSGAAIGVLALAGKMAKVSNGRIICKGFDWKIHHLQMLIDTLVYKSNGGLVKKDSELNGPTESIANYFQLKPVENGGYDLWMDGAPTFRILKDNVVVDLVRNRIFHHTLELGYVDETDLEFKVADSFSNFMHYFINGVIPLMGAYFDQALPANFRANCLAFLSMMPSIKLSKDNWDDQNGAACHMMRNVIEPIEASKVEALDNGKIYPLAAGARTLAFRHRKFAKFNKVKEGKKTKTVSLNEMNTSAMYRVMAKYHIESHFTKACYLPFGGISVELLKQHCPTLMEEGIKVLGDKFAAPGVAMVIIMTLKATKGLKRITLALAQAAQSVNESDAGFLLYGQKLRTAGSAVNVLLAPSLVGPPGQNPWVGAEEDMPEAYVTKTENNYKVNSFKDGVDGHPFDFTVSTLESFSSNTWVKESRGDEWTYIVPQEHAYLKGNNPLMFSINTDDVNALEVNDVRHERDYEAKIVWIRYKVQQTVTRKDANLLIQYRSQWKEHYGKLRSINKCQVVRVSPEFVRNQLNPSLDGIKFDMVCTQDALKLDTLYSMLMLISNTVNANCKAGTTSEKILTMRDMIFNINDTIMPSYSVLRNENDPLLLIEEISVAFGLYQELLDYFEQNFVHPHGIWFDWLNAPAQARIVYNLYTNKVNANDGWEAVANPLAVFPELAKVNGNLVVYRESGDITHKTNVLAFVMDGDMAVGYMQRTYVICGDAEATLVNIELYESSTVQESVSNSKIRMPEIVGISHCIKDPMLALEVQKEMLLGGRTGTLQVKALSYFDAGATVIAGLKPITVHQVGSNLGLTDADYNTLWAALASANITETDINTGGAHKFKQICHALRYMSFSLPKAIATNDNGSEDIDWEVVNLDGSESAPDFDHEETPAAVTSSSSYTLWLPALYCFTKLSSRNENNQDFVAKFFKEILKPLLRKQQPLASNAKQCYSVMKSLLNSENFICLPSGKTNTTAKRIALGDIRVGEIHLTESVRPNSVYQKARRSGINVKAALTGDVFVHGARAPLALGYVAKIIIRRDIVVKDADGNVIERYQVICRPEGEVRADYYLSDVQIGCDVFLPTAYDRGDFDGDGFYITAINNQLVAANTWDDGVTVLNDASALGLFDATNGSYFGDHYGIKTYSDACKTMASSFFKSVNKAVISLEDHADNNARAIKVQHGAVGVAYAVYMIGMIMTDLCPFLVANTKAKKEELDQLMQILATPEAKKLVGLVSEMYEVMLGGYDKGPDMYRDRILDSIVMGTRFNTIARPNTTDANKLYNKEVAANIKAVKAVMKQLGTKVSSFVQVAAIIELTSIYYSVNKSFYFTGLNSVDKEGNVFIDKNKAYDVYNWVALATFIFELGRGNFIGFKGVGRPNESFNTDLTTKTKGEAHQNCAAAAFALVKVLANHVEKNVYLHALNDIYNTLGSVITCNPQEILTISWTKDECQFLADACKDGDDDGGDDDNDGGSTVDVIEPSDDDGGSAVEIKSAEAPVDEEPQQVERGEVKLVKHITRQMLKDNSNALFVFGDNFERRGMGGQAKEMRGEPNAVGIATKHKPSMSADAFLTDADYALAKDEFVNKIGFLKSQLDAGKDIYFPEDGIGTGLSALADHSACIWNYLTLCLRVNLGITKFLPVSELAQEISEDSTLESSEPAGALTEPTQEYEEEVDYSNYDSAEFSNDCEEEEFYSHAGLFSDDEEYIEIPVVDNEGGNSINELEAAPAVTDQPAIDEESAETLSTLDKVIEICGSGDITINHAKQLLISLQHNKVNKQDEVSVDVVPEIQKEVEMKIEAPMMVESETINVAPSRGESAETKATEQKTNNDGVKAPEQDMTQTQEAPARTTETKEEVKQQVVAVPAHKLEKVKEIMANLNDEQKAVVKTVGNDMRNIFLTGKGGAGKSFTVEIIRKCYDILGYPYIVIGSTGTSVVNINGHNTFNGMFGLLTGFKPKKDANGKVLFNDINRSLADWTEIRNNARTSKQFKNRLPKLREACNKHGRPLLIILDEVSMIDSLLLSAVEEALTLLMVDHRWLLVGDPMQFEPVNGWQFFADVAVTDEKNNCQVVKQSVYNQKDLAFTGFNLKNNMRAANDIVWGNALDVVRMHQIQDDLPEIIKQRWEYSVKNGAPKDALVLAPTNKTVKKFNDAATRELIMAGAVTKKYQGKVHTKIQKAGASPDYWLWTGSGDERVTIFAPVSDVATFCVGMRVMLRQTNIKDIRGNMEVNNGQTGTVQFLGDKFVRVRFDNGISKDITAIDMEDPQERGVFTQIPLVPAYALTINKAQGMTFDMPVVFHMYTETKTGKIMPVMMENAFYVALSRLTTSENCYFETKISGTSRDGSYGLSPYQLLLKSYITNQEALNFTYALS